MNSHEPNMPQNNSLDRAVLRLTRKALPLATITAITSLPAEEIAKRLQKLEARYGK